MPLRRHTSNCSGVSSVAHSLSVFMIRSDMAEQYGVHRVRTSAQRLASAAHGAASRRSAAHGDALTRTCQRGAG